MFASVTEPSIVFVATGPLGNLASLLASTADDISSLSGSQLVKNAVSLLVIMGGAFPSGTEWNLSEDPEAAATVASSWPTPIVWSGYEVGGSVYTGGTLDDNCSEDDPVRVAYDLYVGAGNTRPSWDLTAAYYALWPDSGLFELSSEGKNTVNSDGSNSFAASDGGNQWYLIKAESDSAIADALNAILITQPDC